MERTGNRGQGETQKEGEPVRRAAGDHPRQEAPAEEESGCGGHRFHLRKAATAESIRHGSCSIGPIAFLERRRNDMAQVPSGTAEPLVTLEEFLRMPEEDAY